MSFLCLFVGTSVMVLDGCRSSNMVILFWIYLASRGEAMMVSDSICANFYKFLVCSCIFIIV